MHTKDIKRIFLPPVETLLSVASIVAPFAAVVAPPAFGLVPRVGPLRAIVLALSTRFRGTRVISQRTSEVLYLRKTLSNIAIEQYVVVSGPKGVG